MPEDKRPKATVTCKRCGATRIIADERYEINQVLQPYAGGGNYGHCLKCKRTGTMQVTQIPVEKPKKPMGWRNIPEE